jgi:hypothetical protein
MTKFNYVISLIIANMSTKDHIFIKIAGIKNARRKSEFPDVRINMMFSLFNQLKVTKFATGALPSYILETKRPPEICAELGSELQMKH